MNSGISVVNEVNWPKYNDIKEWMKEEAGSAHRCGDCNSAWKDMHSCDLFRTHIDKLIRKYLRINGYEPTPFVKNADRAAEFCTCYMNIKEMVRKELEKDELWD